MTTSNPSNRLTPSLATSKAGRPTKDELANVRRYNTAIWRLVHGYGNAEYEVSILTGLSPASVHRRHQRVERSCDRKDLEGRTPGVFSEAELAHLRKHYGKSKNADIVSFLESVELDPQRN